MSKRCSDAPPPAPANGSSTHWIAPYACVVSLLTVQNGVVGLALKLFGPAAATTMPCSATTPRKLPSLVTPNTCGLSGSRYIVCRRMRSPACTTNGAGSWIDAGVPTTCPRTPYIAVGGTLSQLTKRASGRSPEPQPHGARGVL